MPQSKKGALRLGKQKTLRDLGRRKMQGKK